MRLSRSRVLSLRSALALLPLVAVLPMVLFALFLLNRVWEEGRSRGMQDLSQLLQVQTQVLERELEAYQRELRYLSDTFRGRSLDLETFHTIAGRTLSDNRGWSAIALIDAEGRAVAKTEGSMGNLAARPHVLSALKTGIPQYSDGAHDSVNGQFRVGIALPVRAERQTLGVVHGELMPSALTALLTPVIDGTLFVTVLDRQLRVIARSKHTERYQGQSIGERREALIRADPERGFTQFESLTGQDHRVIWQRASNGWTVVVGENASVYADPLRRSLGMLLIAGLSLLLLGILASRLASRYLERQFISLRTDASRLAAGGAIEVRRSRIAEVRELRQALHEAADRLAQAQAGRERAIDALQQADQRKDEFLSMLAHELRNPLAPLRNALALLQGRTREDATSQRMVTLADRQLQHLIRLVDDLLDVARISRGRLELRLEPVVLQDALNDAVDAMQPRLDERAQPVQIQTPGFEVVLQADRVRLAQVFENLISNASKYSDPGQIIEVSVALSPGLVRVSITDHGIGLRAEELDQVFEMYRQIETAVDRSQGGLGIGLSLVRRLVMLHGGAVTAYSAGLGQGSRFEVLLPRTGSQ